MAFKIIALIYLVSFSAISEGNNKSNHSQKYNLENYALSICLAKGFTDGEINKDAFSAVGAYVELGSYPIEAYEEISELAKEFLAKNYVSKSGESKLTVMKCIDLSRSNKLRIITDKYSQTGSTL